MSVICSAADCLAEAREGDLCWAHARQKRRTGRLGPVRRRAGTAKQRLEDAAIDLRDVSSDDDREYEAARKRFWRAFQAAVAEQAATCHEKHGKTGSEG